MFCDDCDQHIGDVERKLSEVSLDPQTGDFRLQEDLEARGACQVGHTAETDLIAGTALAHFAAGVIFRASLAEHGGVDLGPLTNDLREYVKGPPSEPAPACLLVETCLISDVRARADDLRAQIILPTAARYGTRRAYVFGVPGLVFHVHVSRNIRNEERRRDVASPAPGKALLVIADRNHPTIMAVIQRIREQPVPTRLRSKLERLPDAPRRGTRGVEDD
jgi:hypothetical protein